MRIQRWSHWGPVPEEKPPFFCRNVLPLLGHAFPMTACEPSVVLMILSHEPLEQDICPRISLWTLGKGERAIAFLWFRFYTTR